MSSGRDEKLVEWLFKNVGIEKETRAITVGRYFAIDGYFPRPIRVVTHIHSDHTVGLSESLRVSSYIVGTPLTLDLLEELVIHGSGLHSLFRAKRRSLDYGERLEYQGSSITLVENAHTFGASSVLIELEGRRVGYTGDVKLGNNTRVMRDLDVLVIESTYGSPRYRRPFKHSVEEILVDTVRYGLRKYGRVHIYGYHGKLQEAMHLLRRSGIEEPFLMPERVYRATRVLEKHGVRIGEYYRERIGDEFERYVVFRHFNQAKYRKIDGSTLNVVLTGWEFENPARQVDEHTWVIALSDHGDFDDLVAYVEMSSPRVVVVDASRNGEPYELARELFRRGYVTFVMPDTGEDRVAGTR
ncbi:MBL fold metallo-hydrolase [Thermogladius sp. KZ2Tp1]|uniref:MBL fold metallo-hydrolase n=1 Tax=Thermogladius sp. KZ2Tp1 TaxID=3136289 RepID=UPI003DA8BBAB